MKIIDSLQPEDRVYDLKIKKSRYVYELVADCKHKDHINDHGPNFHYERIVAVSIADHEIIEALKVLLDKYQKAV